MDNYRKSNRMRKSGRMKARRKHKRMVRFRLAVLFLFLCCTVTVTAFALALSVKSSAPETDRHPVTPLPIAETDPETLHNDSEDSSGDSWQLLLVNKWNYIPEDYEADLTELSNGQAVDKRIYPALQEMFDAARSENIHPVVVSGYRTTEKQQALLDEKTAEYEAQGYTADEAKVKAEAWVAVPGTSEHQLGLGIDINADGVHSKGNEVYEWLAQNSYRFGFIRRYPADKTEITGVINEPWHYRYVGIDAAAEIYDQGFCLEEYLSQKE